MYADPSGLSPNRPWENVFDDPASASGYSGIVEFLSVTENNLYPEFDIADQLSKNGIKVDFEKMWSDFVDSETADKFIKYGELIEEDSIDTKFMSILTSQHSKKYLPPFRVIYQNQRLTNIPSSTVHCLQGVKIRGTRLIKPRTAKYIRHSYRAASYVGTGALFLEGGYDLYILIKNSYVFFE